MSYLNPRMFLRYIGGAQVFYVPVQLQSVQKAVGVSRFANLGDPVSRATWKQPYATLLPDVT